MKNKLFLLLILLISTSVLSQERAKSCGSCDNSQNIITNNGNGNFVATSAQAYYWEICSGNAEIHGSNMNQNVSVICTGEGSFTIKVTRFINGNCIVSCMVADCSDVPCPSCNPMDCPTSNSIFYANEGDGGTCTNGFASISGLNNVNYVNWTWALGAYSGTIEYAGTATPIYYPEPETGNWTNHYISICAQVVYDDGTVCDFVCENFLLDCGTGVNSSKINISPNPTKGKFTLKQKNSNINISNITIIDLYGNIIKSIESNFTEIDMSNEKKGIYFIKITFKDGDTEIKKAIID